MVVWSRVRQRLEELLLPTEEEQERSLYQILFELYYIQGWSLMELEAYLKGLCSFSSLRSKMIELGFSLRKRGGRNNARYNRIPERDLLELSYKELMQKYGMSMATIYQRKRALRSTTSQ